MKKLILIGAVIILASCEKDNQQVQSQQQCNCGLILSDDVTDYSIVIRNSCSGNEKKFYLQEGDWMNAYVGSDYCITNVTSW